MRWLRRKLPWLFILLLVTLSADLCQAKTVTLSWDQSPTQTVTGYWVWVSPDGMTFSRIEDAGNALTLTVSGLEDTDDHYFAVTAYDKDFNESINSNVVHSPPIPETVLPILDFKIGVEILR